MPLNIDHNFVTNFRDNLELRCQQLSSQIRSCAKEERIVGEIWTQERLKNPNDTLPLSSTRHGDTPVSDMEHSRRNAFIYDYADGTMLDKEDKVRMLVDPTSSYIEELAGQYNRTIDDKLIECLLGDSFEGKSGATVSALPASQQIAHGGTGLTLDKLKTAHKKLIQGFVDVDREDLVLLTNAEGFDDLTKDAGVINIQNVDFKVNMNYKVPMIAGFKIIKCERLSVFTGASASSSNRPAIAMACSTLKLGIANFETWVKQEGLKLNNWVFGIKTSFGTMRVHDEKVIDIRFQE